MNEYKLSIIVPTFNLEECIGRAFDSVKSQTLGFNDIELIFVDDNSEDNTFNILKGYEKEYSNVKVFKTNINSCYAGKPRNIGLKESTSDYVLFLDGDDQLLEDSCEVLYNKIISTNADVIIGGQINVFSDGSRQYNPPLSSNDGNYFFNTINHKLLNVLPAISAKLFKKSIITDNNTLFPEGIPGQDLVFFQEVIINSNIVITLNNFYVYYRFLREGKYKSITYTFD